MEVSHYYAVKAYSNTKGVSAFYAFLGGIWSLYDKWDGKDRLKEMCDEFAKNSNHDMLVSNAPHSGFGTVYAVLVSHDAIKDYLMKETEYTRKDPTVGIFPINYGFGTESGQKALNNRGIFTDFFVYDRIQNLYDPLNSIISTHFNEFIKNKNIKSNEFTQINMADFLSHIMIDWVSLLLFGCESAEDLTIDLTKYPEVTKRTHLSKFFKDKKKETMLKIICLHSEMDIQLMIEETNLILGGWPFFFGAKEIYRDHKVLTEFINKIVMDVYEKRYNEYVKNGSKAKYVNIIDLLVEHNYNCTQNKNHKDIQSREQIIGSINVFVFAGLDTSLQTSTSCIMHTAKNHQDWISKIKNEGVETLEKIRVNHSLELVIQETLRLYGPSLTNLSRV